MVKRSSAHYLVLLCFLPPAFVAFLILKYGVDLIDWDQWQVAVFFIKLSQGTLSVADLFAQQAEYRQFFPNLIFVSLGWLTHWNIKVEMYLSLALACLIALNVHRLAQTTLGRRSNLSLLTLLSFLIIFTPAQFESWLLGEQIIYFLPALCITTSLRVSYSKLNTSIKLCICLLLCIVSTFSSANGLICWFVTLPVLFYDRGPSRRPQLVIWLLAFLLSMVVYFHGFHKPSYTPSLTAGLHQPFHALLFFFAFLGAPLITSTSLIVGAAGVGALAIITFIICGLNIWKNVSDQQSRYRLAAWLALGSYSVISAAMITVGRLGYGTEQALSSRYVTFSLYLLVSLVYLVPACIDHSNKKTVSHAARVRSRLMTVSASCLLLLHTVNSVAAMRQMSWMKTRRLESKACLLMINVVADECVREGFPELTLLKTRANAINDLGLLRPPLIKSARINDIAGNEISSKNGHGRFELTRTPGTLSMFASGSATLRNNHAPHAVLLTYQKENAEPMIFEYIEMKVLKPSFADLFAGNKSDGWRWGKPISLQSLPLPVTIFAWAFDATSGKAYKLDGAYRIDEQLQALAPSAEIQSK